MGDTTMARTDNGAMHIMVLSADIEPSYRSDGSKALRLTAQPMVLEPAEGNAPREVRAVGWGDPWDGLRTEATIYPDDAHGPLCDVLYREVYQVNASRAKAMHTTLTTVARRMDKIRDELGYTTTFEQHALRFALALGVKTFAVLAPRRETFVTGLTYRLMSPTEAEFWFGQRRAEFQREHGRTEETA